MRTMISLRYSFFPEGATVRLSEEAFPRKKTLLGLLYLEQQDDGGLGERPFPALVKPISFIFRCGSVRKAHIGQRSHTGSDIGDLYITLRLIQLD